MKYLNLCFILDVNTRGDYDVTPLHYATRYMKNKGKNSKL